MWQLDLTILSKFLLFENKYIPVDVHRSRSSSHAFYLLLTKVRWTMSQRDEYHVVIRPSTETDIKGVKAVFRDGAFSNILPAFRLDLQKRPFHYFIVVTLSVMMGFFQADVGVVDVILTVVFCLCVLLAFEVSGAIMYVYGPHTYSADVCKASKLKETYLDKQDTCFWVAEAVHKGNQSREIVGTIAITQKRKEADLDDAGNDRKIAWLRRMVVKQRFRRMGIARRLVTTAIEFCTRHNYDRIELITTDIHAAAKKLYESVGFKCVSHKPHLYFRGYLKVWMYEYAFYCKNTNVVGAQPEWKRRWKVWNCANQILSTSV